MFQPYTSSSSEIPSVQIIFPAVISMLLLFWSIPYFDCQELAYTKFGENFLVRTFDIFL